MTRMPELRAVSTAELRSRIPALERTAQGPKTAAAQATAELRRIEKVLEEREAATQREREARATAEAAWSAIARLESELAEARATAREADEIARQAAREMHGY